MTVNAEVQVGPVESIDHALARLRKQMDRSGVLGILTARRFAVTPSQRRRRKAIRAEVRRRKAASKAMTKKERVTPS